MKIALVNPPGKLRYIRDYYTSLIAKANYYYPPIDFVWLSALLGRPLKVFDAIAEERSPEKLLNDLAEFDPSHIFYLVSGLSLDEDLVVATMIKKRLNARIIAVGDICRAAPEQILSKCPEIDAALKSFACTNAEDILRSDLQPRGPAREWVFRSNSGIVRQDPETGSDRIKIGVPKWDLFPLKSYKFPFARNLPVGTMLTDYGCPFRCHYCSIGTLGWRRRDIGEVLGEIDLLRDIGVKEIHFRDQTFGVDKERTMILMDHLRRKRFTWSCFSRMDVVSEEMLAAMKDSGCHTIIFGIESGDYEFRQKYGKGIRDDLIVKTLKSCSRFNINTVGTFIIGLPGEGEEEVYKTIRFATRLPLDYASFNVAIPRLGSVLRSSGELAAYAGEDADIGYRSDGLNFMPRERAVKLASLATRKFYARPSYIINRLSKIRSVSTLFNEFKIGCNLLFGSRIAKD